MEESKKVCFKCKRELPISKFYKHDQMADGHLNKCKECTRLDTRINYSENKEVHREYEKEREKRPQRKRKKYEYMQRSRLLHPDRYRARTAVGNAIRDGRLKRQPCSMCGAKRAQAHHRDYSKPLEVEWLCFKCHREMKHGQHFGL